MSDMVSPFFFVSISAEVNCSGFFSCLVGHFPKAFGELKVIN